VYSCSLQWMQCMSLFLFLTSYTGCRYYDTFSSSSFLLASFFVGLKSTSSATRILVHVRLICRQDDRAFWVFLSWIQFFHFFLQRVDPNIRVRRAKEHLKLVREQGTVEKDPEKWWMRWNRLLWNYYPNFDFWSLVLFNFWVPKIPKIESWEIQKSKSSH
jgi:hypothetical protein